MPTMPTSTDTLALSNAKITSPSGVNYNRVQVSIAAGTVYLSDQSGMSLGSMAGVVSVAADSSVGGWLVTFDTDEVWTVTRVRGCGCGGGL